MSFSFGVLVIFLILDDVLHSICIQITQDFLHIDPIGQLCWLLTESAILQSWALCQLSSVKPSVAQRFAVGMIVLAACLSLWSMLIFSSCKTERSFLKELARYQKAFLFHANQMCVEVVMIFVCFCYVQSSSNISYKPRPLYATRQAHESFSSVRSKG